MAHYSRAHYRLVSPPADTPQALAWRLADNQARDLACAEREARYPVITPENLNDACAWQEARRAFHLARLLA